MIKLIEKTILTNPQILESCFKSWDKLFDKKESGFLESPKRENLWHQSKKRAQEIESFENLCIVGIGGSSLGAQVLQEIFENEKTVTFFDNVDPLSFNKKLQKIQGQKNHWVIISKSGGTLETLAQFQALLAQRKINPPLSEFVTVISELKDNPLTLWAQKYQVPILELPQDIGGRFSVLTPVGLFPAAFMGASLEDLKLGALWALQQKELVCEVAAQSLMSFDRKESITLFWTYSDQLRNFSFWIQQLWAESLAKKKTRSGLEGPFVSTPLPCRGTQDQHSLLQQVVEGQRDKFVLFFRVEQAEKSGPAVFVDPYLGPDFLSNCKMGDVLRAEAEAVQQTLASLGVESLSIKVDNLKEKQVGALFMFMELVVGVMGEALNINTYDQPGVESGKIRAQEILRGMK
ncbi:MAG: glucose-6-phosphate isomerase [Bdellovibrio sp.]|nr:MAG: glucose-6-phosphate isomerase [Bdellovibrio sp.]